MRGGLDAVEVELGIGNAAGRYGGRPAITAFTASFSTPHSRQSGGMTPRDSAALVRAPASIARTRSAVGGTNGSPSHHSRLQNSA